jgi:hypothetical protein
MKCTLEDTQLVAKTKTLFCITQQVRSTGTDRGAGAPTRTRETAACRGSKMRGRKKKRKRERERSVHNALMR